jgi:NAD(P)-dependent dehydrogenase (short-subunit alcohol dehydrogenase family)
VGIYAITGGATGIGDAVKKRLRAQGHEVLVIDIKSADIQADLSSEEGRGWANSELARIAVDGLDGFVACAGLGPHVMPYSLITRVNYFGAKASVKAARDLVAQKNGAIVVVSSTSAVFDYEDSFLTLLDEDKEEEACAAADKLDGQTAYGAAKYALTRWMRQHSAAYAAGGVRMNAIAPGYTNTPLNAMAQASSEYAAAIAAYKASIPIGFAGEPEDQASAVCYLLSPEARFICGSVLFVDGGSDAQMRPGEF